MIAQLREDEFRARLKAVQGQLDQARATLRALQAGERSEKRLRLESQVRGRQAKLANARRRNSLRGESLLPLRAIARSDYDLLKPLTSWPKRNSRLPGRCLRSETIAREEDIEAAEAAVRGLEGRVVEASVQLKDCTLHAPYDGVIAQRFVEQNQTIKATEPIVKFQDIDEIDVAVDVPEAVMATDIRSADIVHMIAEFSAVPVYSFRSIFERSRRARTRRRRHSKSASP